MCADGSGRAWGNGLDWACDLSGVVSWAVGRIGVWLRLGGRSASFAGGMWIGWGLRRWGADRAGLGCGGMKVPRVRLIRAGPVGLDESIEERVK